MDIDKLKKKLYEYIPETDSKLGQLTVTKECLVIVISSKFFPNGNVPDAIFKKISKIRDTDKCIELCGELSTLKNGDIQSLEQTLKKIRAGRNVKVTVTDDTSDESSESPKSLESFIQQQRLEREQQKNKSKSITEEFRKRLDEI